MEPSMVSEITEDQEYMECVKDILCHPVFQSMDQYIQHGTTTCKTHCIQVSYLGYKLCKQLGGNWRSAARAGLLHDLFLYDWHTHAKETGQYFHGFTHPKAALENADRYFRLTGEERMIILRHMQLLVRINIAVQWKPRPGLSTGFGCACLHSRPDGNPTICYNRPGARLKGERIIRL